MYIYIYIYIHIMYVYVYICIYMCCMLAGPAAPGQKSIGGNHPGKTNAVYVLCLKITIGFGHPPGKTLASARKETKNLGGVIRKRITRFA